MLVRDAQRESRSVFLGGSVGQAVSGTLWALSAAMGTWSTHRRAILVLVIGGMFIFPVTQLVLRALGRRSGLSPGNPLTGLAMQIAFTVPLTLPVVGAATLHNVNWFYPACMIIVGAHYLPFIFLYGMIEFGGLAALLLGGGVYLGLRMPHDFVLGGWFTAAVLFLFAAIARGAAARADRRAASAS